MSRIVVRICDGIECPDRFARPVTTATQGTAESELHLCAVCYQTQRICERCWKVEREGADCPQLLSPYEARLLEQYAVPGEGVFEYEVCTLKVGDIVEWKREGVAGAYVARILTITVGAALPLRIKILGHCLYPTTVLAGQIRRVTWAQVWRAEQKWQDHYRDAQ